MLHWTPRLAGLPGRPALRRLWRCATLALALALPACSALMQPHQPSGPGARPVAVAPGIEHHITSPWQHSRVHLLRIDLRAPGLQLHLSAHEERGRRIDAFSGTPRAAVSLNASFFDRRYTPRGVTVSDGRAWPELLVTNASPLLACDAALRCAVHFDDTTVIDPRWAMAVAGTPWLVRNGRMRSDADDATCAALCAREHPRTAAGLAGGGRWLVVVVAEGRRGAVRGITLAQLSAFMAGQGVQDAINLDGGGSSTLWLHGRAVMNRPDNEPAERPLANALHVFSALPHEAAP